MVTRRWTYAIARVQKEGGDVGRGCTGRHVARVLLMTRRVGENELAFRRGEIAVGHVDRDALLSFRLQPIGEEREVDRPGAAMARGLTDRMHLVLVHAARIV